MACSSVVLLSQLYTCHSQIERVSYPYFSCHFSACYGDSLIPSSLHIGYPDKWERCSQISVLWVSTPPIMRESPSTQGEPSTSSAVCCTFQIFPFVSLCTDELPWLWSTCMDLYFCHVYHEPIKHDPLFLKYTRLLHGEDISARTMSTSCP